MQIVILDGYTLNPGDLSWEPIEQLGNVLNYDRTKSEETVVRCIGADIVLTNKVFLSDKILAQLPKLKFIGILATGINVVDVESASKLGIVVSNVPEYSTHSVAQHTFSLLLSLLNNAKVHDLDIRQGGWKSRQDFSYTLSTIHELNTKCMGILGWGKIGKKVAEIAAAFGMNVQVTTKYPDDSDVEFVSISQLFETSDVISIHSSLTKEMKGLVNNDLINTMKPSAYLLNTSRGQIINDQDLADALNNGILSGAGIDVFSVEPPSGNHPLLHAKNVVLTPHIAWTSFEARQKLLEITANNIRAFQRGNPLNQVN